MLPGMATIAFPLWLRPDDLAPFETEAEDVADAKPGDEAAR
jgi:hypothetical protein